MHIENKWKRYAVGHHLSEYSGDGAELYDALMAVEGDDDKLSEVFETWDPVVWFLYENDDLVDLTNSIRAMADTLQMTASGEIYGKD